jgi:polyisoprenoid-binding protein YceI
MLDGGRCHSTGSVRMSTVESTRAAGSSIPTGEWAVDPARSSVGFSLRHLLFTTLHGHFTEFSGVLWATSGEVRASGTVTTASVDTGDAVRDSHLRDSPDFFGVEGHPRIRFSSSRVEPLADGRVLVVGELQMRGISREVELKGEMRPTGDGGGERIELDLRGAVLREDFGITWNQTMDTGGALLGNRVKIELGISAVRRETS